MDTGKNTSPDISNILKEQFQISQKELERFIEKGKERKELEKYQSALSLWAEKIQKKGEKIITIINGRDTAGKGNDIRKLTRYLNPKIYKIKAFGIPTEEERKGFNWFQRYINYFPRENNLHLFDRSWYNRASVEAVMGFCSKEEYDWFMNEVNSFEQAHIIDKGYKFLKIYLSVSKQTQKKRLSVRESIKERRKLSYVDRHAQENWEYYVLAKKNILEKTDTKNAPWTIIDSNKRYLSAIEIIKAIISTSDEIKQEIEKELNMDLSPNKDLCRTASEELKKMKERGHIPTQVQKFNFRDN